MGNGLKTKIILMKQPVPGKPYAYSPDLLEIDFFEIRCHDKLRFRYGLDLFRGPTRSMLF